MPARKSPRQSKPGKKAPSRTKLPGRTAPAKGTAKRSTTRKRSTAKSPAAKRMKQPAPKKASQVKGKPTKKPSAPGKRPAASTKRKERAQAKKDAGATDGRVVVQNVNVPGYKTSVDADKYHAMREALVKVLPDKAPGLTQAEMVKAVVPHLPPDQFPGGDKAQWWAKTVQLDLEAKGALEREDAQPLRWHKA